MIRSHRIVAGQRREWLWVGLSICLAVGCAGTKRESEVASAGKTTVDAARNPSEIAQVNTTSSPKVELKSVNLEGYKAAIDRHRGDAVLVDFWASWCEPCKRMFPHTVELSRKYRDQGLAVITFSLDDPEQRQDALNFLRTQGGDTENLIAGFGEGVEPFDVLDITGGTIPHFKLYDRQGKLHQKFFFDDAGSGFTPESIDEAVRELLSAKN